MKKQTLNKGFTLIELLVVIAIIGILASVILASLNSARTKARDAALISGIQQVKTALELYYDDHGYYPAGTIDNFGDYISILTTPLAPYLSAVPSSDVQNLEYVRSPDGNGYGIWVHLTSTESCATGVNVNMGWWQPDSTNKGLCKF